jgi:NADH-ubiquinone oxidoreductase chain 5
MNTKSNNAGILTMLTNRLGDVLIILAISFTVFKGGWDYYYLLGTPFKRKVLTLIMILALFTKRAQVPFSSWLPAAMAAPTPVSSLVHSSTLVTAGVYVLVRMSMSPFPFLSNIMLLFFGRLTRFVARASAIRETDLKKIVALSTLSQLGLIVFSLGIGC